MNNKLTSTNRSILSTEQVDSLDIKSAIATSTQQHPKATNSPRRRGKIRRIAGDGRTTSNDELSKKDKLSIIWMPLILVCITAIIGTVIGTWFQNKAFRQNETFRAKLDRVMHAQIEAVKIASDIDEARRQIRTNSEIAQGQYQKESNPQERERIKNYYSVSQSFTAPNVLSLKESKRKYDALGFYASASSGSST